MAPVRCCFSEVYKCPRREKSNGGSCPQTCTQLWICANKQTYLYTQVLYMYAYNSGYEYMITYKFVGIFMHITVSKCMCMSKIFGSVSILRMYHLAVPLEYTYICTYV